MIRISMIKLFLRSLNFKRNFLIITSLLFLPLFFLLAREAFIVAAQVRDSRQKEIKQESYPNEPIEILELSNEENPKIKLGDKFEQPINWLKDFTVKFRNNTDKKITFLMLIMEFPETTRSGNEIAFPLTYGSNPLLPKKAELLTPIQPGESYELKLTDKKYHSLKKAIESRHTLDSLSRITLRLDIIHFEDGTVWSGGSFSKPNIVDSKNRSLTSVN